MKENLEVSLGISDSDLKDCEIALRKFLSNSTKWKKLRSEVPVSYDPMSNTFVWIEGIRFGNFSKETFIILGLLSYLETDTNLSCLLKLELIEKLEKLKGLEDLALLPQYGLSVIKNNFRFNRRYFRSLFSRKNLNEFEKIFCWKVLKPKTSKPKRKIRHKGYRDHGTLPSNSSRALREELSKEASFQILQNEIEEYRENIQNWLSIHRSYLDQEGANLATASIERRIIYVDGKIESKQSTVNSVTREERKTGKSNSHSREENQKSGTRSLKFKGEIGILLRREERGNRE